MHDLKGSKKLLSSTNFRGSGGFEAKAKDLILEAKAKDFKNCPRGQGCPSRPALPPLVIISSI